MRPTLVLATFVAAVAVISPGCGGGDESSASTAAEWANGFCTTVTAWTDELQRIGDDLRDPSSISRDSLDQAANEIETATDVFVEDVRNLGAPETASGQAVEDAVQILADTIESEKANLTAAVEGVSDLTEVATAVTAIGTSLTAMGTAFQNALTAIESADVDRELETAFEQTDSCNELTGSSGS
jgi:hypothetical protein